MNFNRHSNLEGQHAFLGASKYTRIKSAFESLHLWLVVCDDECALLLQKKDLRSGNADSFLSDIISKMNTGTDASG